MPRFVLLLHECPDDRPRPTHCDLMLERGHALETWAVPQLPRQWHGLPVDSDAFSESNTVRVERLADHQLAYLDYEGPVSGERGTVRRLDAGTFSRGDDGCAYSLAGQHIRGDVVFQRSAEDGPLWQMTFTPS
jgi:hypothetical protein